MGVLAVILARGGSVRLPRKNILPLAGVPLIAWTIRAARAAPSVDRVLLSTDDPDIAAVGRDEGADVPFMRPAELATSDAGSTEAAIHAVLAVESTAEFIVLLQPTSPLRTAGDIEATLAPVRAGAPAAVSVREMPAKWNTLLVRDEDGCVRFPEQPAAPPTHALNGAVYVVRRDVLLKERTFLPAGTRSYVMPAERSVDIDTQADFRHAEFLLGVRP